MKLDIQLREHPLWIVWYKASPCEAALDIFLADGGKEGLAKATEELELADVVDMHPH
jgi:hypothetical protein